MKRNDILITNIKQDKSNFLISFDNVEEIVIDEEIYSNHFLYVNKILSIEEYNTILEELSISKNYKYCCMLLSKKQYSSKQIKEKLSIIKKAKDSETKVIIEKLVHNHLLDDEQFKSDYIEYLNNKNYGYYKICEKLSDAGIECEPYEIDYELEIEKGKKNLSELLKKYSSYNSKKMLNSIYESLRNKGFSDSICQKLINSVDIDTINASDDIKLLCDLKKITRRMTQEEIIINHQKIIKKLLAKGYSYFEIIKVIKGVEVDG